MNKPVVFLLLLLVGINAQCPSISFTQLVRPSNDSTIQGLQSSYEVVFEALSSKDSTQTLQGLAFVDLHLRLNNGPETNIRMMPTNAASGGLATRWSMPGLLLFSGDNLDYFFTYSSQLSGLLARRDCDTEKFSFRSTASSAPLSTANPLSMVNNFGTLTGSTTLVTCPAIFFDFQLSRQNDNFKATFVGLGPRTGTLQTLEFVDVRLHNTSSQPLGLQPGLRMNRQSGLTWTYEPLPVSSTALPVGISFLYVAIVNGVRISCDSGVFPFSLSPINFNSPSPQSAPLNLQSPPQSLPQTPQLPTLPAAYAGTGSVPQPLTAPTSGSAVPTQCPALSFSQRLDSTSGLKLVFTANSLKSGATLPDGLVNFIDAHITGIMPEIHNRMIQVASNRWELPLPSMNSGMTLSYWYTYSLVGGTQRIDCDSETFSATTPATTGSTSPQPLSLPIQPQQPQQPQIPQQPQQPQQPQIPQQPQQPQQPPQPYGSNLPNLPSLPASATGGAGYPNLPAPTLPLQTQPQPSSAVCPAITYSQSLDTSNGLRLVFVGDKLKSSGQSLTDGMLNFVDAHITGIMPEIHARALRTSATRWELPISLASGTSIRYWLTYSITNGATRIDCDTETFNAIIPTYSAPSPSAPQPLPLQQTPQLPTSPSPVFPSTASGTGVASFPALPVLPSASSYPTSATGAGISLPSLPTSGSFSTAPLTSAPVSGSIPTFNIGSMAPLVTPTQAVCPVTNFEKNIIPLGNNQFKLSYTILSASRPDLQVQAVDYVDAHYRINNNDQVNVRLPRSADNKWETTVTLQPSQLLSIFWTSSVSLSPIGSQQASQQQSLACDSPLFLFVA